jgi:hypothetical protein
MSAAVGFAWLITLTPRFKKRRFKEEGWFKEEFVVPRCCFSGKQARFKEFCLRNKEPQTPSMPEQFLKPRAAAAVKGTPGVL